MRTKNELLQLMLDNQHLFTGGLCAWNLSMYSFKLISIKEFRFLESLIDKEDIINETYPYYWKVGEISLRIEWIKKQMEL